MIDRITPTQRPARPLAGWQNWRSLLFLHWPVEIDSLRKLVPRPLELDLLDGVAYIGIVPFVMRDIRPCWLPRFMSLNFLETNLRVYVTHDGKPGVYFLSLDANSALAVRAARWSWGLPYHDARLSIDETENTIAYEMRRKNTEVSLRVVYQPQQLLGASWPGTAEHFLLERYLLFVTRGSRVLTGQVQHTPYPAQAVTITALTENMIARSGLELLSTEPAFAHYAAGVDVEIFGLH